LLTLKIDAPCHEALAFLHEQARLAAN
jgi:hypothetical protein